MLHFFAFITAANCISVEMVLSAAYPWIALTDPENGVMDKGWGIGGYLKEVGICDSLHSLHRETLGRSILFILGPMKYLPRYPLQLLHSMVNAQKEGEVSRIIIEFLRSRSTYTECTVAVS